MDSPSKLALKMELMEQQSAALDAKLAAMRESEQALQRKGAALAEANQAVDRSSSTMRSLRSESSALQHHCSALQGQVRDQLQGHGALVASPGPATSPPSLPPPTLPTPLPPSLPPWPR